MCLSASGAVLPTAGSFTNSAGVGYLWSSISVLPNGDALAGGQYGSAAARFKPRCSRRSRATRTSSRVC